jgi:hypothetical protein
MTAIRVLLPLATWQSLAKLRGELAPPPRTRGGGAAHIPAPPPQPSALEALERPKARERQATLNNPETASGRTPGSDHLDTRDVVGAGRRLHAATS